MLERTEHGHHVLRAYAKSAVMRRFKRFATTILFNMTVLLASDEIRKPASMLELP